MKIYLISLNVWLALMLACTDTEYVATMPQEQVVVRTEPPFVGAVWIESEWRWDGGHYIAVPAHWDHPKGTWKRGSWIKVKKGYRWEKGNWH